MKKLKYIVIMLVCILIPIKALNKKYVKCLKKLNKINLINKDPIDYIARMEKLNDYLEYFRSKIWFKQHYDIELPAEICGLGNKFEYIRIKVKDIKREWGGKFMI